MSRLLLNSLLFFILAMGCKSQTQNVSHVNGPKPSWSLSFSDFNSFEGDTASSLPTWVDTGSISEEQGVHYLPLRQTSNPFRPLLRLGQERYLALSFMARFDPASYNHKGLLLQTRHYSILIFVRPKRQVLKVQYLNDEGEVESATLQVDLTGVGPASYGYYMDKQWHHLLWEIDLIKGKLAFWIDGRSFTAFQKEIPPGSYLCDKNKKVGTQLVIPGNLSADLSEIQLFTRPLPAEAILAMAAAALPAHNQGALAQRNIRLEADLDLREFPEGYPQNIPDALSQLKAFPDPRYKVGHTLLPLYNWVNPMFLAGKGQLSMNKEEVLERMVAFQSELAIRWHYMLAIPNSKIASKSDDLSEAPDRLQAIIALANQHPEWPLSVTTLWAQTDVGLIEPERRGPYILDQNLSSQNYATNARGEHINSRGQTITRPLAGLTFSSELAAKDGAVQKIFLERLLDWLDRPIDMINENGEVPPLPQDSSLLRYDSYLNEVFAQQAEGWNTFQAQRKLLLRHAYSSTFLDELPGLRTTRFSWYGVDGGPIARFSWETSRKIHRPINMQYYSTPDFYPRWPDNWDTWKGPWRGWAWIEACRTVELASGDRLFSPFIAAGWSSDPEKNIRPSQWLGLLKALGPLGAEFFYTGFFIESKRGKLPTLPLPSNYVWQLAMPAYAQAITSHYEEILRKGDLLRDSTGNPMLRLDAGDPRVLVTARKYQDQYVIAATIQPISNQKGNVSDAVSVTVDVDGTPLNLEARRQGSVYRWDRSTGKLWQLDQWHELGHPTHWKP